MNDGRNIFLPVKGQFAHAHLDLTVGYVSAVGLKIGIEHLHQDPGIVRESRDYLYFVVVHWFIGLIYPVFFRRFLRSLRSVEMTEKNRSIEMTKSKDIS